MLGLFVPTQDSSPPSVVRKRFFLPVGLAAAAARPTGNKTRAKQDASETRCKPLEAARNQALEKVPGTKKNLAPARGATTFMISILCCSSSLRVPGRIYVKRQVLGFHFAADDQQLEELKVAHYLNAITTAALIPLAKPE